MFKAYDVDGSGAIDSQEVLAVAKAQKAVDKKHAVSLVAWYEWALSWMLQAERNWKSTEPEILAKAKKARDEGVVVLVTEGEFIDGWEPGLPYDPEVGRYRGDVREI